MARDVNDVLREEGGDAVRELLDGARVLDRIPPEDRYVDTQTAGRAKASAVAADRTINFGAFWDGDETVLVTPSLIKRVLPLKGLVFLGGQSGAGKSFLAIHLAICLAALKPFFGKKPRHQSAVLYAAAEGGSNAQPRIKAAKVAAGISERLPIRGFTRLAFPAKEEEFARYLAAVKTEVDQMRERTRIEHVTIIIDTTMAAFTLQDENSAAEIAALCKRARRIGDECDALIILVHHFGKDAARGLRGSSAWRDNTDHGFSIITKKDALSSETTVRNVNIEKNRMGLEGPLGGFTLETMVLGEDEDGDPIEEAYVKEVDYERMEGGDDKPRRERQSSRTFRQAFDECMHAGTKRKIKIGGPQHRECLCVRIDDLRLEFYRRHSSDKTATKAQAFRRDLDGIAQHGLGYSTEDDGGVVWIWRTDD